MDWLTKQLKHGNQKINHKCNCGKVSPKGYGYYCFKHNKHPIRIT